MTRTVAYDLDGTLFSIQQCLDFFNNLKGKDFDISDIKTYDFSHMYDMDYKEYVQTWIDLGDRIVTESKLNDKMFQNLLLEKSKGSDIIIVTARNGGLDELNKEHLKNLNIPYDRYYSNQNDKYDVLKDEKASRFFDDKGELIENLMNTDLNGICELTIVDAPYNKKFKSHSRFYL